MATLSKPKFYSRQEIEKLTRKEIAAALAHIGQYVRAENPDDHGARIDRRRVQPWRDALWATQEKWQEAQKRAEGVQLSLFDSLNLEEKLPVPLRNKGPLVSEEEGRPRSDGKKTGPSFNADVVDIQFEPTAFTGEPPVVPQTAPLPPLPPAPQDVPTAPDEEDEEDQIVRGKSFGECSANTRLAVLVDPQSELSPEEQQQALAKPAFPGGVDAAPVPHIDKSVGDAAPVMPAEGGTSSDAAPIPPVEGGIGSDAAPPLPLAPAQEDLAACANGESATESAQMQLRHVGADGEFSAFSAEQKAELIRQIQSAWFKKGWNQGDCEYWIFKILGIRSPLSKLESDQLRQLARAAKIPGFYVEAQQVKLPAPAPTPKGKCHPIVPWVLSLGDRVSVYAAPQLLVAPVVYATPSTVRLRGDGTDGNAYQHRVFCIPDELSWVEALRLREEFDKALKLYGETLLGLGNYRSRLAEAGGVKAVPLPLTPTAIKNWHSPEQPTELHDPWKVPASQRYDILRHTAAMLQTADRMVGVPESQNQYNFWLCPDEAAWERLSASQAAAERASETLRQFLSHLGTYEEAVADERYSQYSLTDAVEKNAKNSAIDVEVSPPGADAPASGSTESVSPAKGGTCAASKNYTGIEWTDRTWNPVTGCTKVSDGCRNCYADCQSAGVSFFFKQVGGRTPKSGGRLLDGKTWDEMPAAWDSHCERWTEKSAILPKKSRAQRLPGSKQPRCAGGSPDTAQRHPWDFYQSPAWYGLVALQEIPLAGTVFDPCAGDGAISSVLASAGVSVVTNDFNPEFDADFHVDAAASWQGFPGVDWVITNPPFRDAFSVLLRAWEQARVGVALFLRQSFTEPTEARGKWLSEHPPTAHIDLPRFKFRQGKNGVWATDSSTISLFVWLKQPVEMPARKILTRQQIPLFYDSPITAPDAQAVALTAASLLAAKNQSSSSSDDLSPPGATPAPSAHEDSVMETVKGGALSMPGLTGAFSVGVKVSEISTPIKRPRVLDLFCGGGGASEGYHRAGYEVVGVDCLPQKNYPFTFVQADALQFLEAHWKEFDIIHASPPCQAFSSLRYLTGKVYPNLLEPTLAFLRQIPRPFIVENVEGAAPLMCCPLVLCGQQFGLRTYRHRAFEIGGFPTPLLSHRFHSLPATKQGRPPKDGEAFSPTGNFSGVKKAREIMDIAWMGQKELSQAIPPAYTEWLARQAAAHFGWSLLPQPKTGSSPVKNSVAGVGAGGGALCQERPMGGSSEQVEPLPAGSDFVQLAAPSSPRPKFFLGCPSPSLAQKILRQDEAAAAGLMISVLLTRAGSDAPAFSSQRRFNDRQSRSDSSPLPALRRAGGARGNRPDADAASANCPPD